MPQKYPKRLFKGAILFAPPFLLSICILCVVYSISGLFPFGSKTVAWADMVQQALPFMMQFKQIAAGGDGLLFTMGNAGGMNFWGVLLYFIASPFTLLSVFVPLEYFHHFANVLLMLKIGLAACSATWFFARQRKPFVCSAPVAGALGVLYAFSGYSMLYYQNIVWLDQLILFPLLLISLDYMREKGNFIPYTILLALTIFCHFQVSVMVILAVLLCGGIYALFCAKAEVRGKFALRLAGGSVLAVALSTFVWLPALLQYAQSPRSVSLFTSLKQSTLVPHLYTTLPMLLCTAAIFGAIAAIMARGQFKSLKVRCVFLCFVLFSLPLFLEPVNLIWHGGSYQAFPSRFAFIPVLFGLWLCAAALQDAPDTVKIPSRKSAVAWKIVFALACTAYVLVLGYVLMFKKIEADFYVRKLWGNADTLKWGAITALAGAVAFALLFILIGKRVILRSAVPVLLCGLVVASAFYNSTIYIGSAAHSTNDFMMAMDIGGRLPEEAGRVRQSRKYTDANNIGAMGYASISHYSSLTRDDFMTGAKKLGYSGYWMEMTGPGGTALSDAFLNIDAFMCQADAIDPLYNSERLIYQNNRYALVEAPYNTEYGLVVDAQPEALAELPDGDRFAAQDWLYQNIYGGEGPLCIRYAPNIVENVELNFSPETGEHSAMLTGDYTGSLRYSIQVEEEQALYFDCFRYNTAHLNEPVNNGFEIHANGVLIEKEFPSKNSNGLLYLGSFVNQRVDIDIIVLKDEVMRSFGVSGIVQSDVDAVVQSSQAVKLDISGSRMDANLQNATQGQLLLLSVAYDEGFSATVNGREATVHKVMDTFMAVELESGDNHVQLRFRPSGLFVGGVVSVFALLVLLFVWLMSRKKKADKLKLQLPDAGKEALVAASQEASPLERAAYVLLVIAMFAAFIAVYIMPMVARAILRI